MKVNYDMAVWVNNELKVKVDDQQVDMKHLNEQYNIDDADEVQKTTVPRTPTKTCYQTFAMRTWLKKTYLEQSNKALWNYYGKMVRNKKEFDAHMYEALPVVNGTHNMMLKMTKKILLVRWKN